LSPPGKVPFGQLLLRGLGALVVVVFVFVVVVVVVFVVVDVVVPVPVVAVTKAVLTAKFGAVTRTVSIKLADDDGIAAADTVPPDPEGPALVMLPIASVAMKAIAVITMSTLTYFIAISFQRVSAAACQRPTPLSSQDQCSHRP
jgi:hypothetical protein